MYVAVRICFSLVSAILIIGYAIRKTNNFKFEIEVDGGIDFTNSKEVINAGANILVSGTTIFKENNGDLKKNIETLKKI